ncbi:MAG: hypothetical protein WCQ99_12605 [Pseudomonadota bacterium]
MNVHTFKRMTKNCIPYGLVDPGKHHICFDGSPYIVKGHAAAFLLTVNNASLLARQRQAFFYSGRCF